MHQNVEEFSQIIKQKVGIEYDQKGQSWKKESVCHRLTQMLKCHNQEKERLLAIGKIFSGLLDSLEKAPILFNVDEEITKKQIADLKPYLQLSETIMAELGTNATKEVRAEFETIQLKILGLK